MSVKPTYEELEKRIIELELTIAGYRKTAENQRFIDTRQALIEFAATHTLDELLTETLDVVTRFVDSAIGFYHFVDSDQKTLSLQQWSTMTRNEFCLIKDHCMHRSIDKAGTWADCVLTKVPVIHNDYMALPHKKGLPQGHAEIIRELIVPVMRRDKVVAILGVGNKPDDYTKKDAEIVSYFADVTWEIVRQKKAEKAFLDEKQRSEEYINSLPGLFYVFDEFKLVKWNSEVKQVTGYSDGELVLKNMTDFVADRDKPLIRETMRKVYSEGTGEAEADLVTKEGKRIPYFFTGVLKKLDGKKHLIGLGVDNTERKRVELERQRLQEKLQQSCKMEAIGVLAGGIAHKFNNYLSGISGNIELLEMTNANTPSIMKYAERMNVSVLKMAHLSNQLLAYAEGGKYMPKILSIKEFIDNSLTIIAHKLPSSTKIATDVSNDILNIEGDPVQIQMVLSAVVENAAEAINDTGTIKIVVKKEEQPKSVGKVYSGQKSRPHICIKVIDNGRGMDQETQRRIFEPFFTTHLQGRGLGMAAVYGIVKNHYGWIDIESEPGKGTVVSIYLPAVENRSELSLKLGQINDRRKFKRYKIRKNAFAALKSNPSFTGCIIDICKEGLAYAYPENGSKIFASNCKDLLTISSNEMDFFLDNIPCDIIADVVMDKHIMTGDNSFIRRSIRFSTMSLGQKMHLNRFIEDQAV